MIVFCNCFTNRESIINNHESEVTSYDCSFNCEPKFLSLNFPIDLELSMDDQIVQVWQGEVLFEKVMKFLSSSYFSEQVAFIFAG